MTDDPDLFGFVEPPAYPDVPGHRGQDTSREAAEAMIRKRAQVLGVVEAASHEAVMRIHTQMKFSPVTRSTTSEEPVARKLLAE
jgi:hypothetical protein